MATESNGNIRLPQGLSVPRRIFAEQLVAYLAGRDEPVTAFEAEVAGPWHVEPDPLGGWAAHAWSDPQDAWSIPQGVWKEPPGSLLTPPTILAQRPDSLRSPPGELRKAPDILRKRPVSLSDQGRA
jgi:hypothetical protein